MIEQTDNNIEDDTDDDNDNNNDDEDSNRMAYDSFDFFLFNLVFVQSILLPSNWAETDQEKY